MKPIRIIHNFGGSTLYPSAVTYEPNGTVTVVGKLEKSTTSRLMGHTVTKHEVFQEHKENMLMYEFERKYVDSCRF